MLPAVDPVAYGAGFVAEIVVLHGVDISFDFALRSTAVARLVRTRALRSRSSVQA